MSENVDKRTATQKIEDLERVVTALYQANEKITNAIQQLAAVGESLQNDNNLMKDALKLLNRKVEAIVQVAASGSSINPESVNAAAVKLTVNEMSDQVAGFVKNGHITSSEEVALNSYVVVEELTQDGVVVNPRVQFRLDSQPKEVQDPLLGKKVGELANFGEGRYDVRVLEVYSILPPKSEVPAEAPPEAPAAPAEAAPAEVAAPEAPRTLDPLPAESPLTFGIEIHGEKEVPSTDNMVTANS